MKIPTVFLLLCAALCLCGCFHHFRTEQRVVELPANDPGATIGAAAKMGKDLYDAGLFADVRKHFPSVPQQVFTGLYLRWNAGVFSGKQSVFFTTGIQYEGDLPEAKEIANYCQSKVQEAVNVQFPSSATMKSPPSVKQPTSDR